MEKYLTEYWKKYDKYVFIDIDGTLLDTDYKTNCDFSEILSFYSDKIWLILNSDTPIKSLFNFQKYFNISKDNIVIWEYWSCIWKKDIDSINLLWISIIDNIKIINKLITSYIKEIWYVYLCDAQKIIQNNVSVWNNLNNVFLINKYRENSFSFYIRKNVNWNMLLNYEIFKELKEKILSILINFPDFYLDSNFEYWLFIIHYKWVHKKRSFNFLDNFILWDKFMIWNSMSDFIWRDDVLQYAVSNSDEDYKIKSRYVSNYEYTQGVFDILHKII